MDGAKPRTVKGKQEDLIMGSIAVAIRGIHLPEQNKRKLLSLDQEFVEMEAEIQTLKSENLLLQAKVNPLEREIERLKSQIKKNALPQADHHSKRRNSRLELLSNLGKERLAGKDELEVKFIALISDLKEANNERNIIVHGQWWTKRPRRASSCRRGKTTLEFFSVDNVGG